MELIFLSIREETGNFSIISTIVLMFPGLGGMSWGQTDFEIVDLGPVHFLTHVPSRSSADYMTVIWSNYLALYTEQPETKLIFRKRH